MKVEDNNLENELWERREYRRRRRVRNQIIVTVTTVLLLAAIVIGGVFGVRYLIGLRTDENKEQEVENVPEESLPEESVTVESPEEYAEESQEDTQSSLDSAIDTIISQLPLEDKVAGLFFITPEALTDTGQVIQAGDTTREKLLEYAVGGLIYFSDNIQSGDQLAEMLNNTISFSKYPIFLGVDEEGGEVSRVAANDLGEKVDSMGSIGAAGDTQKAYEAGQIIGTYLAEYGFNTNFAPVADVLATEENQILAERSFGTDPGAVAGMVSETVRGLRDAGIYACVKHFPGLGSADTDTHDGIAINESTREELQAAGLLPFKAGMEAGAEFVMVGHVSLPNVTGDNTPSSLSDAVIGGILRDELGYNGIVITDALNMGAITDYYTSAEACVTALQAGADMLLMPENFKEAYEGVLQAVNEGTISPARIDDSLRRIYRVKYADEVAE